MENNIKAATTVAKSHEDTANNTVEAPTGIVEIPQAYDVMLRQSSPGPL